MKYKKITVFALSIMLSTAKFALGMHGMDVFDFGKTAETDTQAFDTQAFDFDTHSQGEEEGETTSTSQIFEFPAMKGEGTPVFDFGEAPEEEPDSTSAQTLGFLTTKRSLDFEKKLQEQQVWATTSAPQEFEFHAPKKLIPQKHPRMFHFYKTSVPMPKFETEHDKEFTPTYEIDYISCERHCDRCKIQTCSDKLIARIIKNEIFINYLDPEETQGHPVSNFLVNNLSDYNVDLLRICPNNKFVACLQKSNENCILSIHDLERKTRVLHIELYSIQEISFSPNSKFVGLIAKKKNRDTFTLLRIYDIEKNQKILGRYYINNLQFSPDSKIVILESEKKILEFYVYNLEEKKYLNLKFVCLLLQFCHADRNIVSIVCTDATTFDLYDITKRQTVLSEKSENFIDMYNFNRNGTFFALKRKHSNKVDIYNLQTNKWEQLNLQQETMFRKTFRITFSPNDRFIAVESLSYDYYENPANIVHNIEVYNLENKELILSYNFPNIYCISESIDSETEKIYHFSELIFSPDSKFIVSGTYGGDLLNGVKAYNLETQQEVLSYNHKNEITNMFFSPKTNYERLITIDTNAIGKISELSQKLKEEQRTLAYNAQDKRKRLEELLDCDAQKGPGIIPVEISISNEDQGVGQNKTLRIPKALLALTM